MVFEYWPPFLIELGSKFGWEFFTASCYCLILFIDISFMGTTVKIK